MPKDQIGYKSREELIKELQLRLADGIVDVELDREHYDVAIDKALSIYRQLSSGSVEESIIFIETIDGQTETFNSHEDAEHSVKEHLKECLEDGIEEDKYNYRIIKKESEDE